MTPYRRGQLTAVGNMPMPPDWMRAMWTRRERAMFVRGLRSVPREHQASLSVSAAFERLLRSGS